MIWSSKIKNYCQKQLVLMMYESRYDRFRFHFSIFKKEQKKRSVRERGEREKESDGKGNK